MAYAEPEGDISSFRKLRFLASLRHDSRGVITAFALSGTTRFLASLSMTGEGVRNARGKDGRKERKKERNAFYMMGNKNEITTAEPAEQPIADRSTQERPTGRNLGPLRWARREKRTAPVAWLAVPDPA